MKKSNIEFKKITMSQAKQSFDLMMAYVTDVILKCVFSPISEQEFIDFHKK